MVNMDRDNWKEKLEQGFAELTPDCWDEISKAVSDGRTARPASENAYRKPARRRIPAMLAAAAVLLCAFFIIRDANTVSSMLYIDVNPSVCISINERGKAVSIEGVNDDGCKVADAVHKEIGNSRDLGKTVSCIIAEIGREGYFGDGTVDALVSLCYSEKEDKDSLDTACRVIEEYASSNSMKSNLVSQSFAGNEADEKTAAGMGISVGKYEFMTRLVKEGKLDRERMADLSEKSTSEIFEVSAEKTKAQEKPGEQDEDADSAEYDDVQKNDNKSSVNKNKSSKKKSGKSSKDKKPKKKKAKKSKKNNGNSSSGNGSGKGNKDKNSKNNSGKGN